MSTSVVSSVSEESIQPFIESTKSVFSMMLGCEVQLQSQGSAESFPNGFDVSGIISLAGAVQGMVVISLDSEVAFGISETLVGTRPNSINEDVRDLVGELANMIGGNAKERMGNSRITLGLPTVISGKGHAVTFEAGAQVQWISFTTPWGTLAIEIGLRSHNAE